jgi:hypothetical protein
MMHVLVKHVALPAIAPAAVIALYFTPVMVFGCVNRGILALCVVLVSAVAAFIAIGIGVRARAQRRASAPWWLLSALIFTLPLALVLGPLG